MKLIIDIPDKKYKWIKEDTLCYTDEISEAIRQGTPLEAELEKIKAEIMSIGNWREHYEMPIAYLSCLTIVEHHISELKGESGMTYRYCAYHGIECDYKCNCIDCPHNTEEDTKWFKYVFEIINKHISEPKGENK